MKKASICLWITSFFLLSLCDLKPSGENVYSKKFYSEVLEREWKYNIYLPESYADSTKKYPILYLLHGHAGNENEWFGDKFGNIGGILDRMIEEKRIPEIIVVGPDARNTWYVDEEEQMETAIIKELIPKIETQYRVLNDKRHRAIGGLSAGGYGSLRFILIYPELFKGGIILSPAAYTPIPPESSSSREIKSFRDRDGFSAEKWKKHNYPALWEGFLDKNENLSVYIAAGDADVFDINEIAGRLSIKFKETGAEVELRIIEGGHNWEVWRIAIKEGLVKIFQE